MDAFPVLNSMPFSDPTTIQNPNGDNHNEFLLLETHLEQIPSVPMSPFLEAPIALTGLLDDTLLPYPALVNIENHHAVQNPINVVGPSNWSDGSSFQGQRRSSVSKTLNLQVLSNYFHLPHRLAAKELQIGETCLKDRCRMLGIKRWPFKKLESLKRLIQNVQTSRFGSEVENTRILRELEETRERILGDPNLKLDKETRSLLNKSYKINHRRKYRKIVDLYLSVPPEASSSATPTTTSPANQSTTVISEEDEFFNLLLGESEPPMASSKDPASTSPVVLPCSSDVLEDDEFINLIEDFYPPTDIPSSSVLSP